LLPILLARLICCIDSFRICLFQHRSGSKNQRPEGKALIYVRYRTDRIQFLGYHFIRAMGNIIPRFGHDYLVMAK
jgi:hypothetical protein